MSLSPASILYDSSGIEKGTTLNPVKTDPTGTTTQPVSDGGGSLTVDGTVAANQAGTWNINNVTGTVSLPTGAATESTLVHIRDTGGIKKITDALPAGTNRLGAVRNVDANDVALDVARNTTIPAGTRALIVAGESPDGKAQAIEVRVDAADGRRRIQIEGKVYVVAPAAPPSTTPVTISADTPLSISKTTTKEYIITNGTTFHIQQVACGCEGDTSERGSAVEVIYYDGTLEHLIERIYVNGLTQYGVLPDTGIARDGTVLTGNGSTKKILLRRRRLSGSAQEVDAVVRGYES